MILAGSDPQLPVPPSNGDRELIALRSFRDDVLAELAEAGHITKAEIEEVEARFQERLKR